MVKATINGKVLPILFVISLLSSAMLACQVKPAKCLPANSIWIEPSEIVLNATTTPVGYRFNVTVYTNLSVSTFSWQIYLTYNKNHLNATGCWYSAGSKSEWAGANPTQPFVPSYGSHNATHNYILYAESLIGDPSQVNTPPGHYSLAIIEFKVVAVPPEGEFYHSEIRLDIPSERYPYQSITKILDTNRQKISLNYGGATYIIDEFTIQVLLIFFIISICIFVLKRTSKKAFKTTPALIA